MAAERSDLEITLSYTFLQTRELRSETVAGKPLLGVYSNFEPHHISYGYSILGACHTLIKGTVITVLFITNHNYNVLRFEISFVEKIFKQSQVYLL